MKKRAIGLFILLITLTATLALAISMRTTLEFTNIENSPASGTARISHSIERNNLHDVNIKMRFTNLPNIKNTAYEGWLVDINSNYKLSLGAFLPDKKGKANFNFNQELLNFTIYDKLVITREFLNDTNPNPDKTVLTADIPIKMPTEETPLTKKLEATISSDQEVPPTNSNAYGRGVFTIDTRKNTLKFDIIISSLNAPETGAHIHGPASRGQNADILFPLPPGNIKGETWNYEEVHEDSILSGKTYVNIHSTLYPNGEIRGQIEPIE